MIVNSSRGSLNPHFQLRPLSFKPRSFFRNLTAIGEQLYYNCINTRSTCSWRTMVGEKTEHRKVIYVPSRNTNTDCFRNRRGTFSGNINIYSKQSMWVLTPDMLWEIIIIIRNILKKESFVTMVCKFYFYLLKFTGVNRNRDACNKGILKCISPKRSTRSISCTSWKKPMW
jgi:hypothetical protein